VSFPHGGVGRGPSRFGNGNLSKIAMVCHFPPTRYETVAGRFRAARKGAAALVSHTAEAARAGCGPRPPGKTAKLIACDVTPLGRRLGLFRQRRFGHV
jgi:hypothetical protein